MKNIRRRQGQGMTEYIVIVGLIAILLIGAVNTFSNQIDVTIQGTTDTFKKKNIGDAPPDLPPETPEEPPPPERASGRTSTGVEYRANESGGYEVRDGTGWVPYNPADHGSIGG